MRRTFFNAVIDYIYSGIFRLIAGIENYIVKNREYIF
jgi:hypothetical protein